ncbi:hypothetical protein WDU94_008036 [Cyamophila willieti]
MKVVCLTFLSVLLIAELSNAFSILASVNATTNTVTNATSTIQENITHSLEAIRNRAVDFKINGSGNTTALGKVQISLGDRLELSGLTSGVTQVETIVLRQLGGVVTILLKRVLGLVYEVVEIVPALLNTLVSGIQTNLSLLGNVGGYVLLDVATVGQLVLKTVQSSSGSVNLVLTLN